MAGTSLLALLDDIASILDDVAAMSKVAARKTASVLSDDLALNAQQVSGVRADRELPVVWKVAKGSLINKAILVPLALAISAFIPWAITPLLMLGGSYLCYEGVEKLIESRHRRRHEKAHPEAIESAPTPAGAPQNQPAVTQADVLALENKKVKGAVRTDFILSAEIIVISLGTVASAPLTSQVAVMVFIALAMTVGVYGIVAAIVKMDDVGLYLSQLPGTGGPRGWLRAIGRGVVNAAPLLMKSLSVIGTLAMFLVGGSILAHGLPWTHSLLDRITEGHRGLIGTLLTSAADMLLGLVAGGIIVAVVALGMKIAGRRH
ncbi:DUF808 domain-containing protein [Acerihabitans arboris]|uniref:DUF808 family protein n=1 Tax=Acerihabitans arboris TaxID=2691583 RepID=A0A845SK86_9GAMM|nr:DUF808 domain-containing protein [Acerihabitans arboris]NDL63657.1 DUF808 family protein [Acerihabitans arboris]